MTNPAISQGSTPKPPPLSYIAGCHRCQCDDDFFADVFRPIERIINSCAGLTCQSITDYAAYRRRNTLISAAYARMYLNNEAFRSRFYKFAAGAAYGSTAIGWAMDDALGYLKSWGDVVEGEEGDMPLGDGTNIENDESRGAIERMSGLRYDGVLAGLRRLIFGNLAIFVDLATTMNFFIEHERRFMNLSSDPDGVLECFFDHFVSYMYLNHANTHPVFREIFGRGTYMRGALTKMISGNHQFDAAVREGVKDMVAHEQTLILQPLMYEVEAQGKNFGVSETDHLLMGDNDDFAKLINTPESLRAIAGSLIGLADRDGIHANFTPTRNADVGWAGGYNISAAWVEPNPPFKSHYNGGPFEVVANRLPWFQDVLDLVSDIESAPSPNPLAIWHWRPNPIPTLSQGATTGEVFHAGLRMIAARG